MHTPLIETERLLLRLPRAADAADVFHNYAGDPEVCRYLTWVPNVSVEQTEEFMRARLAQEGDGRSFVWAITLRGDDRVIGMIDVQLEGQRSHRAEASYVLARRFWGRGLMTETLRAVVEFAFTLPGVYRVGAVCDVENAASARVMEKAGMTFEGVLRRYSIHPNLGDEPRDSRCYALTR